MLRAFLDYLRFELNRAPLTIEAYSTDLLQFGQWLAPNNPENIDFKSVTSSDVRTWLASLARAGVSPRSLRRKIISLRALFKWMMKNGFIENSPLKEVPLPKIPKPLPDFIKPEEIEQAIRNLAEIEEDDPLNILNRTVVEMLYSLGIRRAELVAIDDADISFSKGEVKVTGKRSKQRVIPVPEKLLGLIRKWQESRPLLNEDYPDLSSGALFCIKGKRITPNRVYAIVHEALAESSARKKSPHALRHSFASGMLNGGADLDSVREFLGHASLSTTQIYTHISLKEIKKAYSMAHPRSNHQDN